MATMPNKDIVKEVFSDQAGEWAASYARGEKTSLVVKNLVARQRFVLDMMRSAVPRGSKVLDLGCGPGETSALLMQRGYDVWGVDIAEPMIRHARERCGTDQFRLGDLEDIPFPDGMFDAVVCLGAIEYLDSDAKALGEIRRVLVPGGTAILATPSAVSPLFLADRVVAAAEPVYARAKARLRGERAVRTETSELPDRFYRRGSWYRRLKAAGLQPQDWVCYGWGWYVSRFGGPVERMSRLAGRLRQRLAPIIGEARLQQAGKTLARNRLVNWLACEQLVLLRATSRP
jgi:ubiquinone/menaquinone biosynthesis C-methylase UbiE